MDVKWYRLKVHEAEPGANALSLPPRQELNQSDTISTRLPEQSGGKKSLLEDNSVSGKNLKDRAVTYQAA